MGRREQQWLRLISALTFAVMLCGIGSAGQQPRRVKKETANAKGKARNRPIGETPMPLPNVRRPLIKRQGGLSDTVWLKNSLSGASMALSPDGQLAAIPLRDFGQTGLFRVSDGSLLRTLAGHTRPATSLAFSPDGTLLASAGDDGSVKIGRVNDGSVVRTLSGFFEPVVAFSPDGGLLAVSTFDTINLYQVSDGALVRSLTGHADSIKSLAFSREGTLLASGSEDRTIKIYQVSDGALQRTLADHTDAVTSVAFSPDETSPDGILLASGSLDRSVRLWRVSDGAQGVLANHLQPVFAVAFSPDGSLLASAGDDNSIFITRISDRVLVRTLPQGSVRSLAFSSDGSLLASGSLDDTLKLFAVSSGNLVRVVTGETSEPNLVAFSPDGQLLATRDTLNVKIRRASDGGVVRTLNGHTQPINAIAYSPDGQFVASGGDDKTAKIHRVSDGALLHNFTAFTTPVLAVAFSSDSSMLAVGGNEGSVSFFDVNTGAPTFGAVNHAGWIRSLAFSSDGQFVASASLNGTVKLIRLSDRGERTLNPGGSASAVAFSPDSQNLAAGTLDGKTQFFRVSDGAPLFSLPKQNGTISSLSFSPDGQALAMGTFGDILLFNASNGSAAGTLSGHTGFVFSVAFSPAGGFLASGGGGIAMWRVGTGGGSLTASIPDMTDAIGQEVVLDASASQSIGGTITAYEWDLDNDGQFDDATGVQVRHTFNGLGQFFVHVQVRDDQGRTDTDSATITVVFDVDLTVTSLTIEPSSGLQDGTPTTLKAIVRNQGRVAIANEFQVVFKAGVGREIPFRLAGLAAGGQAEVAVPWRVRGGTNQIEVMADASNVIQELSETNNTRTLDLSSAPAPDLTVTSVSVSPDQNLVDGLEVEVAATVANQGATTTQDVMVAVTVNGSILRWQTIAGGLLNGQSQTVKIPFRVQAGQGQTPQVVADPQNKIGESNETNNARDVTLPSISAPDLTVSGIEMSPSSNVSHGQPVTLRATVRNLGVSTQASIRVNFQMDGQTFDRGASLIAGLPGGQSAVVEVPWTAVGGAHTIRATVDPLSIIPESNETNNAAEIPVSAAALDLIVQDISANPPEPVPGDPVKVTVTVHIAGSGQLTESLAVELRDNDQPVGELKKLDAGLSAGRTLTLVYSWQAQPGARTLNVVADPLNRLPESSENNNTVQTTVNVPTPDLALSAVTITPEQPVLGGTFIVQGQVRNVGVTSRLPIRFEIRGFDADGNSVLLPVIIAKHLYDLVIVESDKSVQRLTGGVASNGVVEFRREIIRPVGLRRLEFEVMSEMRGNLDIDGNPSDNVKTVNLGDVPLPDYALTGIETELPSTLGYGQPVTFRVHVTNRGGSFHLRPWINERTFVIDILVNDRKVATTTLGGLDNNVSTVVTTTWLIDQPIDNPTVRAVLDSERLMPDADRTNNTAQAAANLTVQSVDLAPQSVTITPANVPAGGLANVVVTVRKNPGADFSGLVPVEVFVDGVSLGVKSVTLELTDAKPEGTVPVPFMVTPGSDRVVRVVVDPRNSIPESDENNNTLQTNIVYAAAAPDFVVDSVDFSPNANVKQGDTVRLTVGVRNVGIGRWASRVNVRVRFNTGFERTLAVDDLAPNETKTVSSNWLAAPGSDNLLTVEIDPDNTVLESNEDNNNLSQRLPFNVAPTAPLRLSLGHSLAGDVFSPGDEAVLNWRLVNNGSADGQVTLSASVAPQGSATVEPPTGIVPAHGGALEGQVRVDVPSSITRTQDLTVTLQAQVGATTLSAQASVEIQSTPVIRNLTPENNQRPGSTTVVFNWETQISSTSEVFIKRPVDADFQRFTAEPGTRHRVVVSNLRRNSTYLFYVRSAGVHGEAQSAERRIFVTNSVAFDRGEYAAEVKRDYDQQLAVLVINNDDRPHTVRVEVADNPHPDAVIGLIGEGSIDQPVVLNPNSSIAVTFAGHFQDAQGSDYAFRIRVVTLDPPSQSPPSQGGEGGSVSPPLQGGEGGVVDEAVVRMRLRESQARLQIRQIAEDPLLMVKTFRVTNVGSDPATDVTIAPEDLIEGPFRMMPAVEHAFIAPGGVLEFKVFPQILPPDFRSFSPSDIHGARLTFESHPVRTSSRSETSPKPFDLFISVNDVEVGSLQNMIPDGIYTFNIPPEVLLRSFDNRNLSRTLSQGSMSQWVNGSMNKRSDINPQPLTLGANPQPSKDVVELPPDVSRNLMTRVQAGTHLQVRYGNHTERVPVSFDAAVKRQVSLTGSKMFLVNKGERTCQVEVKVLHCTNRPDITIRNVICGPFRHTVNIQKSNFNEGHFVNLTNIGVDVCTGKFQVVVNAKDEQQARSMAEQLCTTLTKDPPKPKTVTFQLTPGEGQTGPPFKRGKPVIVRATVSGDGELSLTQVVASFSNGETILLQPVGGNTFEGVWIPKNITGNPQKQQDGSFVFPTTVTVTASGCGQIATASASTEIKVSGLKIVIDSIQGRQQPEDGFVVEFPVGKEANLHIVGRVVDSEGVGIADAARLLGEIRFSPTGESFMQKIVDINRRTQQNGTFVIDFENEKRLPGEVKIKLVAILYVETAPTTPGARGLLDSISSEPKILKGEFRFGKFTLKIGKEGFKVLRSRRDGTEIEDFRENPKGPGVATVEIPDPEKVKDILITVHAWQVTDDNRLEKRPLRDAVVQLEGGGSTTTDGKGEASITIGKEGTNVKVEVELYPDLEVKVVSVPSAYLGREDVTGEILIGLGKNLEVNTDPKTGLTRIKGSPSIKGRQFKVDVAKIKGRTDGDFSAPTSFEDDENSVVYHPPLLGKSDPKSVTEEITVQDTVLPYKATLTFKVFRNAFMEFSKKGFAEIDPVNIDLLPDTKKLPDSVVGLVRDESREGIREATVKATIPDAEKTARTELRGGFNLKLSEGSGILILPEPITLPFDEKVLALESAIDALRGYGYNLPFLGPTTGYSGFEHRLELRLRASDIALQEVLDSVERLDAAVRLTTEVDPLMKEYLVAVVEGVIDLALYALVEFKVFDKIIKMAKLGRGIRMTVQLQTFLRNRIQRALPSLGPEDVEKIMDIIRSETGAGSGLTDDVIGKIRVEVTLTRPFGFSEGKAVEDMLQAARNDVAKLAFDQAVAAMKGQAGSAIKSLLSRLGVRTQVGEKGKVLLDRVIDSVLKNIFAVLNGDVFKLTEFLAEHIAEGILSSPVSLGSATPGLGYRRHTQQTIDSDMRELGKFLPQPRHEQLLDEMKQHEEMVRQIHDIFKAGKNPATAASRWVDGFVRTNAEVLTGEKEWWKSALEFMLSVAQEVIPVKSGAKVLVGGSALALSQGLQDFAWSDAVGRSHPEQRMDEIESLRQYAQESGPSSGRSSSVLRRSPPLDDFTNAVNQIKDALRRQDYEQTLNLMPTLTQTATVVNEAAQAQESLMLNALAAAFEKDNTFPARARQASDAAERAQIARQVLLLSLNSFFAGESDTAGDEAVTAADQALSSTQEASALLDGALQQLQSLSVPIPALLYAAHQEEQTAINERRLTFTVTNIGGEASPAAVVRFETSPGAQLSQQAWNVPALAPGGSQTLTITVRLLNPDPTGSDFVRTRLEDFTVDFVPVILFLNTPDTIPPTITDFLPAPASKVRTVKPTISAIVMDNLSGIDRAATRMKLDGQNVNAAYDIKTRVLSFQADNLSVGKHTVVVETKDLDGNPAQQSWDFTVDLNSPVDVTDVNFVPNPFSPNADGQNEQVQVRFKLNGDATLTVSITDAQGQVIKTLANQQTFTQGEHNLTWDGTTDDGQPAPDGSYNILVTIDTGPKQSQIGAGLQTHRRDANATKLQVKFQNAMAAAGISLTRSPLNITDASLSTDTMRLTQQTAVVSFTLSKQAKARVKVYQGNSTDDDGFLVRTLALDNATSGQNIVGWDGRDDEGRFVPPAPYSFSIEADDVTSATRLPFAGQVNVQSLPDLLPVTLTKQDVNGQTKLTATVRNIGGADASNVIVRFFHQGNSLGDVTIAQLAADGDETVELSPNRGLLTMDLSVEADPDKQIDELEEFNNTLSQLSESGQTTRMTQVLSGGLSLVSVPLQLLTPSPTAAFGFPSPQESKVATWNPQGGQYQVGDQIASVELGRGYFIKLPSQRTVEWEGIPAPTNQRLALQLQAGWNLIGNPHLIDLLWDLTAMQVRANGQTRSLKDALDVMEDFAWVFEQDANNPNTGRYVLVYDASVIPGITNKLRPAQGGWVFAKAPCELLLPAPNNTNANRALAKRKRTVNDWLVTLSAEANGAKDSVSLGASSSARSGDFSRLQIAKPPLAPEQGNVQLFLVPSDEAATVTERLGVDVRQSLAAKETWHLIVRGAQPNMDITLRWNDLGTAPRPLRFYLIDEATGKRRYMRTQHGYTFRTDAAGEEKQFRIELDTTPNGGRLLNHLNVVNNGVSGAHFSFVLSQPAMVNARIITPTGKVAAVVARGVEGKQGLNTVTWNGKSASGAAMARGVYIVEVTAVTEEGQEMREVRTFTTR